MQKLDVTEREWMITYVLKPTNYNPRHTMVVLARSAVEAEQTWADQMNRRGTHAYEYKVESCAEYKPGTLGKVVSG